MEIENTDGPVEASTAVCAHSNIQLSPANAMAQPLRPEHIEYLKARAVTVEDALSVGVRSISAEEGAKLLGFRKISSGGLLIPYPLTPGYHRIRLDLPLDGGARFLAQNGATVPVYTAGNGVMDPEAPLYVVEGPIKALALAANGLACVGLGGVATTLERTPGGRVLNKSWAPIPLDRREVTIVFDAGRANNPDVARAESRLAMALEMRGAVVRVATLPLHHGQDRGPDDFIAQEGFDDLRLHLMEARPANPLIYIENLLETTDDQARA